MASTASLSPLTTLRMPAGRPASMNSSAMRIGTPGSRSDGFRMKALPQAIAGRDLPQRDHGREVERRDAGDDAERLAHRIDVDAGAGAVGELALHQVRRADAELDHLEAALDVALGVGDGLAVLAREQFGQRVVFAWRRVRGTSSARGRGAAGWSRPRPAAPPWRSRRRRAVRPWRRARPCRAPCRPSAGRRPGLRPLVPATRLPPMKWPYSIMSRSLAFFDCRHCPALTPALATRADSATVVRRIDSEYGLALRFLA